VQQKVYAEYSFSLLHVCEINIMVHWFPLDERLCSVQPHNMSTMKIQLMHNEHKDCMYNFNQKMEIYINFFKIFEITYLLTAEYL
jgi:hypothetical protein